MTPYKNCKYCKKFQSLLGAKAVGEQSFLMAVSAIFALRRAIDSVRKDLWPFGPHPFYMLGMIFYLKL